MGKPRPLLRGVPPSARTSWRKHVCFPEAPGFIWLLSLQGSPALGTGSQASPTCPVWRAAILQPGSLMLVPVSHHAAVESTGPAGETGLSECSGGEANGKPCASISCSQSGPSRVLITSADPQVPACTQTQSSGEARTCVLIRSQGCSRVPQRGVGTMT